MAGYTVKEAWKSLEIFQSSDLVRRQYKRRHNLELNAETAGAITAALTQGRQYFAELKSVGDLARPLVLFYGVMALARAGILFLQPGVKEESLLQGHGLKVNQWNQTLAVEGTIKHIPDLQLTVEKGTFTQLADATRAIDRVQVHYTPHPPPNADAIKTASQNEMGVGWSMALRDLLGRIPELHNIYEETFEEHAYCRRAFVLLRVGQGPFQTTIDVVATRLGLPHEEKVRQDLGLLPTDQLTKHTFHNALGAVEHWNVQQSRETLQDIIDRLPFFVNDSNEMTYVYAIPRMPSGWRLSKMLLLYATSYAVGMLCRYYPSRWVALLSGGRGDFSYPLLAEALRVVENVFPQVLDSEFWAKD